MGFKVVKYIVRKSQKLWGPYHSTLWSNKIFPSGQIGLREVNIFIEAFSNYMRSSPNVTIPEGTQRAQVNVNVDQYWLTEIKERKFTKENTLEEFLKIIEEINILKFPVHHRRVRG